MNERIAELAEQAAQESALIDNDMNLEVTVEDNTYSIPATFISQFAELIVRECVSIADEVSMDDTIGYALLEHFGVEE